MTAADKVLQALHQARDAKIAHLKEIEIINPSHEVLESIEENGGQVISRHWDQWCHSDTCAHNSHDPGQEEVVVAIPSEWIPVNSTRDPARIFVDIEDESLIFVIPCEDFAIGVFVRDHGRHFAPSTIAAKSR